jgi:hypothetical protein
MAPFTLDSLAEAYFRHQCSGYPDSPDYAVVEEVDAICRVAPNIGWLVARELCLRAPSDNARGYVAAGPVEALLRHYGDELADAMRSDALRSPEVQAVLGRVLFRNPSKKMQELLSNWIEFLPGDPE